MRKLKLQVQISIDGFIGGPNGDMDWLTFNWSDDINEYVTEITEPVDTILLGKNLAMGFIPHWQGIAADPNNPEQQAGKKYTDTHKVVFSTTLKQSEWANTDISSQLITEVMKLKKQKGQDMIAYGGASFVSSLLKEQLVDELHLFVNPVILGKGMSIYQSITGKQKCELALTKQFDCGIVLLKYKVLQQTL
jgi:dihydrofolate reductase